MHTWILLIVKVSAPKPKAINFAKFKRKRTHERLFPLQNAIFCVRTLPSGFESFFYVFFTLLERNFATPERPKCPERQKPLRCSFFHTHPHNWSFFGLELKIPVLGSSRYFSCLMWSHVKRVLENLNHHLGFRLIHATQLPKTSFGYSMLQFVLWWFILTEWSTYIVLRGQWRWWAAKSQSSSWNHSSCSNHSMCSSRSVQIFKTGSMFTK